MSVAANGSGSDAPMNISVTIKGEEGSTLGTRSYSIASSAVLQLQFSAREVTNANFNVAGAEFRITSGSASVVPYASAIDNNTADAVFVSGVFPQTPAPTAVGRDLPTSAIRFILNRVGLFD